MLLCYMTILRYKIVFSVGIHANQSVIVRKSMNSHAGGPIGRAM